MKVQPWQYMRAFKDPYLRLSINGRAQFKWLCTSHYHQDNLYAKILAEYDPFVRNGVVIKSIGQPEVAA